MSIGLILLKLEDIDKARYYLKKAFYTKTPVLEDKSKAERLLKIVSVIRDDLQKLARCANEDCDQIMDLCDRLGDHFVEVKCYSLAIKYYKQELTKLNKQTNQIVCWPRFMSPLGKRILILATTAKLLHILHKNVICIWQTNANKVLPCSKLLNCKKICTMKLMNLIWMKRRH